MDKDKKISILQYWNRLKQRKRIKHFKETISGIEFPAITFTASGKIMLNLSMIKLLSYPDNITYVLTPNNELLVGSEKNYVKKYTYKVGYSNKKKSGAIVTFPAFLWKMFKQNIQLGKRVISTEIINTSRGVKLVFHL